MPQGQRVRLLTQSSLSPGNCWQTAVACIFDVAAEELPDQVKIEAAGFRYANALNAFLWRHFEKMYVSLEDLQWFGVNPPDGPYLWEGPTLRTPDNGGIEHVVVAREREMLWDPHPSRSGLTEVKRWGVFLAVPRRVVQWRDELVRDGRPLGKDLTACSCPKCAP